MACFSFKRASKLGFFSFAFLSTPFVSTGFGQQPPVPDTSVIETRVLPETVRTALNEVVVQLQPGTNQAAFAQQQGLSLVYSLPGSPDWAVFSPAKSGTSISSLLGTIAANQQVKFSEQNYLTQYTKFSFTPNDPLYATSGGFNGQWHLNNSLGRPSANLTAAGAWASNTPGQGVIIGDVDDGIEPTHPDIVANFNATHTFDFIANSATQTFGSTDAHGMSTSGVAAARGGNGIGVTGSAPFAQIASMKVFTGSTTATNAQFAAAVMYHSSGADTSVTIKNQSYGISNPFVSDTTHNNGITTSANAGTVHVLSAGNERGASGQDSNKKMAQANPNVITVSALGFNGVFADYSCFGANITVTAPSNRTDVSAAGNSISTTDRVGANGYNTNGSGNYSDLSYTNNFGGTSSAAPLVTGIMALGKQANPAMEVRLAKHILARTSTQVDASDSSTSSDGGWRTNAAGIKFNQNYGFGLINGDAFVNMVSQYTVSARTIANSGTQTVTSGAIPDNSTTGITRTFTNLTAGLLEEVVVTLNITHARRGDVTAFLTSPSGYVSRLFISSTSDTSANISWDFVDNAFWGEQAQGTWSITVEDVRSGTTGTWNSFAMSFRMGTIVAIAVPEPTTIAFIGMTSVGTLGAFWHRRRRQQRWMDEPLNSKSI